MLHMLTKHSSNHLSEVTQPFFGIIMQQVYDIFTTDTNNGIRFLLIIFMGLHIFLSSSCVCLLEYAQTGFLQLINPLF
jgi:putative Mn2+ efflux pump MntP